MFRSRARRSRARATIPSDANWTPDKVVLHACGPGSGEINVHGQSAVEGWQTWRNDNLNPDWGPGHAYVRATVMVDGSPMPVNVDTAHPYRRQVNDTTYELLVGPGGTTHTVPFTMAVADLPLGSGIPYAHRVEEVRHGDPSEF